MIDQHVKDLKSLDSARRREAIRALAQSGDPRATDALSYAARTDPDQKLRTMAANALRQIQQPAAVSGAAPAPTTAAPEIRPLVKPLEALPPAEIPLKQTDDQSRKRAVEHLNRAYDHRLKGEIHDGVAELGQAIRFDPALAADTRAVGLAAALTGAPPEQAIRAVIDRSKQWDVRRQRIDPGRDATVFALELLLLIGILTAVFSLFSAGLVESMSRMLNAPVNPAAVEAEMSRVFRTVKPAAFLTALPSALLLTGLLIFWNVVTFWIGLRLGGSGMVLRFLKLFMAVQIVAYTTAVLVQPILLGPVLASAPDVPAVQTLGWLSVSLSGLCVLAAFVGQAYVAGREHRIGFVKGLLSVILSSLIVGFFWAILSVITFGR